MGAKVIFMVKTKPKHASLNFKRFNNNPLEKEFVKEWRELNKNVWTSRLDYKHLIYIVSPNQPELAAISDRDIQIAETVIQWLGSTVGQYFVKTVMKNEK